MQEGVTCLNNNSNEASKKQTNRRKDKQTKDINMANIFEVNNKSKQEQCG